MTGFSRDFLESIDNATGVAYRGEPGNIEAARATWRVSDAEREALVRIAGVLRDADDADVARMLADANGAVGRAPAGDDLRVHTWEPAEPPDRPFDGEV